MEPKFVKVMCHNHGEHRVINLNHVAEVIVSVETTHDYELHFPYDGWDAVYLTEHDYFKLNLPMLPIL